MRNLLLTLAATAVLIVGSFATPNAADARPRGYYRAGYYGYGYRPYYYGYRPNYRPYYAYPRYYNYGYYPRYGYGYYPGYYRYGYPYGYGYGAGIYGPRAGVYVY
jgi:hypothetical protein